jgi:formylglycine-generating enzyme required for sulfatase activity
VLRTPADRRGGSCVDKAGACDAERRAPAGGISRAEPVTGWAGDRPEPCTLPPRENEICVPDGAFILGDTLALEDLDRRSQPERMRVVEPFFIDKFEMSVARYRAALARGFLSPDPSPTPNPEPVLARNTSSGMCTWSVSPGGREAYPLNCITWNAARALCNFLEGDLPTEDQWEHAATAAGRDVETPYPWGRELPGASGRFGVRRPRMQRAPGRCSGRSRSTIRS